jgi:preprotein translocase subunit SecE
MASKVALVNGDTRMNRVTGAWKEFTQFLSDVRGEMRKVVTPSRKEVEATTTVVVIAVFLFGLYFFVVDSIFSYSVSQLFKRLGAQ